MRVPFLWAFIRGNCYVLLLSWLVVFVCARLVVRQSAAGGIVQKMYRRFMEISLVIYMLVLFYVTVWCREPFSERHMMLVPLWEYRLALAGSWFWVSQIVDNIILFIPMGVLYGHFDAKRKWMKALFLGMGLSAFVECMQYLFKAGLCETDDVLNNTIGMMLGYLFWTICERIKR